MPPRLAHKKSRRGCRRCKERKVKCGEEWPSCAACLRHCLSCEYAEDPRVTTVFVAQTSHTETSRADTNESSSPGLDAPYPQGLLADFNLPDAQRHAVELYLIHRFKCSVAPSFSAVRSPEMKDIWVWDSVDLAFDFPCLLNGLFAITSLYIWITSSAPQTESERKPIPESLRDVDYAQLHRIYLNLSICQQRDALENLTPESADAVGLTAFLHSTMATCLLSEDAEAGERQYTPPIQWLMMHASITTVFYNAVPFLKPDGPMTRFTTLTQMHDLVNPAMACDPRHSVPFLKLLTFQDPTDFTAQEEEADPLVEDAYIKTVAVIGGIHKAVQSSENRHQICMRVVAFGHTIPKIFIRLLAARRPRTLAIIANYIAFVRYIDQYWWFRHRAEKELSGIRTILPPQWQWALAWPLAVLQEPAKASVDPRQYIDIDMSEFRSALQQQ